MKRIVDAINVDSHGDRWLDYQLSKAYHHHWHHRQMRSNTREQVAVFVHNTGLASVFPFVSSLTLHLLIVSHNFPYSHFFPVAQSSSHFVCSTICSPSLSPSRPYLTHLRLFSPLLITCASNFAKRRKNNTPCPTNQTSSNHVDTILPIINFGRRVKGIKPVERRDKSVTMLATPELAPCLLALGQGTLEPIKFLMYSKCALKWPQT